MQSGSYNDEFGLRMDFTYNDTIKHDELVAAEKLVLEKLMKKL